jgi:nicotinamidase-related amidase
MAVLQNVHHKSSHVVLFIDLLNHFEFPNGRELLEQSLPVASRLVALKRRARRAGVPVVYVNDNFGQWRSDARRILEYCTRDAAIGRDFVRQIAPDEEDYFVLKPMHSGFYQTPLDALLRYFGAITITLCGIATNSCIVCTAHDAKMRDFEVTVAGDCCASYNARLHAQALEHMKATAGARILRSSSLRF